MRPCSAVQVDEQVEHVDLVGEVEVRRRLVEEHQVGALGQRHRDPHPLALAARQLVDRASGQIESCSVTCRACSVIISSSAAPLPEPLLVRVAAAGDEIGDGDALRGDRRLRQDPEPGRDLLGRTSSGCSRRRAAPRRPSAAAAGPGRAAASTCRTRWRRRCRDLARGGSATERSRATSVVVVPEVRCSAARVWCPVGRSRHPPGRLTPVRRRASRSQSRYGAPTMPVTMPTGSSVGRERRRATRSEQVTSSIPISAAGTSASAEPDEAAGDRRRDEGDEGDRAGGGRATAASATPTKISAGSRPLDADAEPLAVSSPSCSAAQRPAEQQRRRHEDQRATMPSGRTCSQLRPFRLPVSQTVARCAS